VDAGGEESERRVRAIRDDAAQLLKALRTAGCDCFIDPEDGNLYVSPPAPGRRIEWPEDFEAAFEWHYRELKALVSAERLTIH
jgi:hypothetical protein